MGDFEDGPVDFAQALVQLPGLQAETMNYEITTSILSRVTRVYLRGGQMVAGVSPVHSPRIDEHPGLPKPRVSLSGARPGVAGVSPVH